MPTVGEIAYNLKANTQDFQRGMQVADASLRKLDVTTMRVASTTGRATPGLSKLQNTLANVGFAAAGLPGPLGRVADKLSGGGGGGMGLGWKQMHEAGRIAAESAKKQMEDFGAVLDRIKGKLQDLAIWQLAAQRMNLETSLRIIRTELASPAMTRVRVERITEGKEAERFKELTREAERLTLALADLDRIMADKTWARDGVAAAEEVKMALQAVVVSIEDLYAKLGQVGQWAPTFGDQMKKAISDQLAKDMEALARTNEEMSEKMARDIGEMAEQVERDARRAAEAINRIQSAVNALLDILDDLRAGNFGSVLGTIFGGIIGFAAGGPQGALVGAQIGGRVGGMADSSFHSNVSSPAIAPGGAVVSLNVSGMPPAMSPLAASRDGDWIRFLSESTKVARSRGMV